MVGSAEPDGTNGGAFTRREAEIVILVDADACPVKDEVYRVAERQKIRVVIVANTPIAVPKVDWIVRVTVGRGLDVADDWIAAQAGHGVIVITADIPLAARCVKTAATVVAPNGKTHTEATIGATLATRNLMDSLRSAGEITAGPRPFAPRDRSAFLSALDLAVQRLKRSGMKAGGHI